MNIEFPTQVSLVREGARILLSARDGTKINTLSLTPRMAKVIGQELLRLVNHEAGARSGVVLDDKDAALTGKVPMLLRKAFEMAWGEVPKLLRGGAYVVEIARLHTPT